MFIVAVQNVAKLIGPDDASNNLAQGSTKNNNLWMILERIPGHSLKKFIEQKHRSALGFLEAIQLVLKLADIVEQVHNKGVFHQNLSPENIMIECDSKQVNIDKAKLTLLNFSQVDRILNETHVSTATSTQKWYQASQASIQGLSSTIDASGVCAILFWLLTKMDPRHEDTMAPHLLIRDKLNETIDRTVNSISMYLEFVFEISHNTEHLPNLCFICFRYGPKDPVRCSSGDQISYRYF